MAKQDAKKTRRKEADEPGVLARLRLIGTWFAVLLLAILGVWGSVRVREQVRSDPRYSLESWRLELAELPSWVTPEIQAELESLVDLASESAAPEDAPEAPGAERLTLFDRGVLRSIQERLERSPWVDRLVRVALSYPDATRPGALYVELGLRRPAAFVQVRELYYLTDRDGRRLGAPYDYAPTEWFGIPRIAGVEASVARVPGPGERWDSIHVENGLWVANYLKDHRVLEEFADHPIEVIDVSNVGSRRTASEIVLIWEGRRLTWGQAPLSGIPRTVSLESVVQNLRRVLSEPEVYAGYEEIHLHREVMTGIPWTAG